MSPLFCIFAHPDDEAFGPGGSIALFSQKRPVYIICVTDGNANVSLKHDTYENLGQIRKDELLQSADVLGVKEVFFLNFPDGTLSNNIYHEVAKRIEEVVIQYDTDTFLTFEEKGISGHLDHIAVSMITTYLFNRLPGVKKLMYYCEPEQIISQLREDYFIYMPEGHTKDDVQEVINISSVWDTKKKAMECHRSQQEDIDRLLHVMKSEPKEEYFLVKEKS